MVDPWHSLGALEKQNHIFASLFWNTCMIVPVLEYFPFIFNQNVHSTNLWLKVFLNSFLDQSTSSLNWEYEKMPICTLERRKHKRSCLIKWNLHLFVWVMLELERASSSLRAHILNSWNLLCSIPWKFSTSATDQDHTPLWDKFSRVWSGNLNRTHGKEPRTQNKKKVKKELLFSLQTD